MKHKNFLEILLLLAVFMISGCKKKKINLCETVSSKGRIIGYDPCLNYGNGNNVSGRGFVIEIEKGATLDTTVTYGIPNGLFDFPYIDENAATNGQFLYAPDIQDNFKIKFNYRLALENEKTAVLCRGNIWTWPFNTAVKGKEIFITCISPR